MLPAFARISFDDRAEVLVVGKFSEPNGLPHLHGRERSIQFRLQNVWCVASQCRAARHPKVTKGCWCSCEGYLPLQGCDRSCLCVRNYFFFLLHVASPFQEKIDEANLYRREVLIKQRVSWKEESC